MNMALRDEILGQVAGQGLTLLGEIISWNLPENTVVTYQELLQALRVSGLDETVARQMRPRHAFARAAKQLQQERIIRCTEDKPAHMLFQFTKEHLFETNGEKRFLYSYETTLRLDKDTGHITTDDGLQTPLTAEAQRLLEKAKNERTTADITRYIMTLFEREADLFPVRNAGGVYFVPQRHVDFVEKIETLVSHMNGNVTRFPVPAGTRQGNKSVKEAVQQGLQTLIEEHLQAVDTFGSDTKPSTLERQARRIEETKFKIEAYSLYLEDKRQELANSLAAVGMTLKQKTAQILTERATKAPDRALGLLD